MFLFFAPTSYLSDHSRFFKNSRSFHKSAPTTNRSRFLEIRFMWVTKYRDGNFSNRSPRCWSKATLIRNAMLPVIENQNFPSGMQLWLLWVHWSWVLSASRPLWLRRDWKPYGQFESWSRIKPLAPWFRLRSSICSRGVAKETNTHFSFFSELCLTSLPSGSQ